jgi:hypothetical protein
LGFHSLPTDKHGADQSYHTSLNPMLFIRLSFELKGGVLKSTVHVQKSSQSDKPNFQCFISLVKPSPPIYQSGMHLDGSAVDIPQNLHLFYISPPAFPVFSRERK